MAAPFDKELIIYLNYNKSTFSIPALSFLHEERERKQADHDYSIDSVECPLDSGINSETADIENLSQPRIRENANEKNNSYYQHNKADHSQNRSILHMNYLRKYTDIAPEQNAPKL